VRSKQFNDDRLDNPIFNRGGFIGTMSRIQCMEECKKRKDPRGRSCVAIEMSTHSTDPNLRASCALAWGCDFVKPWGGGDVYMMPKLGKVFNGNEYILLETLDTWTAQKARCEELGANLVSILSKEEHAFVLSLRPSAPAARWQWMWIGMKPDMPNNKIVNPTVWLDGSKIGYTNWARGQPSRNEGCSEIFVDQWHDNNCNAKSRAVCKKPAGRRLEEADDHMMAAAPPMPSILGEDDTMPEEW